MDDKYIPQDAYVIVKEALSLVGTEKQSDLLEQNCEDFSTWLHYGKGESRQLWRLVQHPVLTIGAAVVGMIAVRKNH
ncbi:unnamed protein product [Gadus morhua 'NCC']